MSLIKLKRSFYYLIYIFFLFLITACKKGEGAICNDGSRSYSTGRGTCSWHGGVDHYLNPDEIDVGSTIGLVFVLIVITYLIIKFRK